MRKQFTTAACQSQLTLHRYSQKIEIKKSFKPLKDIDVNKGFKTIGHKCASPNPKLPAGARVEGPIGP